MEHPGALITAQHVATIVTHPAVRVVLGDILRGRGEGGEGVHVMMSYAAMTVRTGILVSHIYTCTVEPPNKGHLGTRASVLYSEVSFIRRLEMC